LTITTRCPWARRAIVSAASATCASLAGGGDVADRIWPVPSGHSAIAVSYIPSSEANMATICPV
jgi:hypothetical protein